MPRLAPLVVVLVTLLAGCTKDEPPAVVPTPSPSPPPPPEPPTEGSVVARVNDTWTYRGDGNESVVSTVTGANASVVRLKTVSQREGAAAPHTTITLFDARTLAVLSIQDDTIGATLRFDPPLPILIPAEDHDYNGSLVAVTPFGEVRQPATGRVLFLGLQEVRVPAGEFQTFRYNATIRSEGLFPFTQATEIWFSPDVEQAVKTIRDGRMQELVGYEIA